MLKHTSAVQPETMYQVSKRTNALSLVLLVFVWICSEFQIVECCNVLYFDVSDDTMTSRLLDRGKTSGRVDDNEETIKKRLQTFHNQTQPVIDHFTQKNKVVKVGYFFVLQ